jgi:hypothetical protein
MTSAFVDGMNIKIQQPEQKAWPHVQRKVSLLLSQSCKTMANASHDSSNPHFTGLEEFIVL